MKPTFRMVLLAGLLLSFTNFLPVIIAAESDEFSNTLEIVPDVPSIPALPQDNEFLCGDVNEDGSVDVLDIISMVNYILGIIPDPFNLVAADINADDAINVLDIIAIVNIILVTPGIPCPCLPSVDYEGQVYNTVQIGEQCWLKENLNVGIMINSDQPGFLQTDNGTIEKYCFGNDAENCDTYGGLYEWTEAMQYLTEEGTQGICPPDWHISSDDEWKILEGTVDSQFPIGDPVWNDNGMRGSDAGSNLKEAGTNHWDPPNDGATNSSGFTALPGGARNPIDGGFDGLLVTSHFWSSSEVDPNHAMRRTLTTWDAGVERNIFGKWDGLSIRCVKGCFPPPTPADAGPDQLNLPGTATPLQGNFPNQGTGIWEVVSGTGYNIFDPGNPNSVFQGIAGHEYTLSWTITTACGSSSDEAAISFEGSGFNCGDISLSGEFNGWVGDHFMTRDDVNPDLWSTQITLSDDDDVFAPYGIVEVKFRADADWGTNWGATDFPSGIGFQGGPNIPLPLNEGEDETEYYVTFNCVTGEYYFDDLLDFACGDYVFDDRDDNVYPTIQIGTQCWFRKNMNVGDMIQSDQGGQLQTDNGNIEKYCQNNDASNCDTYGGLYEWDEAMEYVTDEGAQGICPDDWHIATHEEWKTLEGTVDSQYPVGDPEWDGSGWRGLDAGGNLKETGTFHWTTPNEGATNESGFTALGSGQRYPNDGSFVNFKFRGFFWTSSEFDPTRANDHYVVYELAQVGIGNALKESGFAVRCISDCTPYPAEADAGPDQVHLPGTSTMLEGSVPDQGTGLWEIVSGTGGTIDDPADPSSGFEGIAGNVYTLSWTISTVCGSITDRVMIHFEAGPCPGIPTVDYEGQTYNTVLIGDQCWFRENLNVGDMIASDGPGSLQTDNGFLEKYCINNEPEICNTYGGLYEWGEAMQYIDAEGAQGICPDGWRIPSDNDWKILEGTVDSKIPVGDPAWDGFGWRGTDAGGNLKEEGTDHWNPPNEGATNYSGFTAIAGGFREADNGGFIGLGNGANFWSSSESNPENAFRRVILTGNTRVQRRDNWIKASGLSIRCLKDE